MLDQFAKSSGKQAFHLPASFKQILLNMQGQCSAHVFQGQRVVKRSVVMGAMSTATFHEGGASGSTETARFFSATAKSTSVVVSSIVCSTQAGNHQCAALSTLQAGRD